MRQQRAKIRLAEHRASGCVAGRVVRGSRLDAVDPTAGGHKINVVCVIGNNGGWTADAPWTRPLPKPGRHLGHTRYDRMAVDLGAHGEFVEKPTEIRPALERAFASGKPTLIEAMTDPDGKPPLTMYGGYPEPF